MKIVCIKVIRCLTVFYLETVNIIYPLETWGETQWFVLVTQQSTLCVCVCVYLCPLICIQNSYIHVNLCLHWHVNVILSVSVFLQYSMCACVFLGILSSILWLQNPDLEQFECCLLSQGHCIRWSQSKQLFQCTAVHLSICPSIHPSIQTIYLSQPCFLFSSTLRLPTWSLIFLNPMSFLTLSYPLYSLFFSFQCVIVCSAWATSMSLQKPHWALSALHVWPKWSWGWPAVASRTAMPSPNPTLVWCWRCNRTGSGLRYSNGVEERVQVCVFPLFRKTV